MGMTDIEAMKEPRPEETGSIQQTVLYLKPCTSVLDAHLHGHDRC
ncbi:hypothetical protein LY04_03189 [Oceanimonas baumannii]|uniref:Uncharacterized protein n=1 Tax=Oceanimonas baumannii TaxID=129578 RepID=A0ABY2EV73_9GAMM|nr:hypothetical protein LY04_03189 [Oceanimonas baumannii]